MPPAPDEASPILLFNGTGTSPGSVKGIAALLEKNGLKYATVDSKQLNRMNVQQLTAHRLLIIPGGNYITIGRHLTDATATNVHDAVQSGMNYLGTGKMARNSAVGARSLENIRMARRRSQSLLQAKDG